MKSNDWLAKKFEENREHLKAVAYRMLGSSSEAEDAVQEAWTKLARSDSEQIENLSGWLTTVVARVCLDTLRSKKSKHAEPLDHELSETLGEESQSLEENILIADAVGPALLVVLDLLTPAERIAFVLHDLFDLTFEDIAPIIDRTEEATRQLASRARKRVRGTVQPRKDRDRQQDVVSAFLAASRSGDFEALIRLLHPDATLRADETAIQTAEANKAKGAPQFKREIKGAKDVANTLKGKAMAAQLAFVDGLVGSAWAPGGRPVVVFRFSVIDGKISDIIVVMDPTSLSALTIEIINLPTGDNA